MGHNSSRGTEQSEISLNHPKFIKSKIVRNSEKEVLQITLPCDQNAYKTWKDLLKKYGFPNHQYLLLPIVHRYHSSGFCSTRGAVEVHFFQIQIGFDNYPYLLTEEIHHRKEKKVPFSEPELWYLLYALLSSKNYIKQQFQEYPFNLLGDIRPQNVFLSPTGEVKFSNMLSWPGQKVNYRKTFDGFVTYLSPEDYELLELGSMNNEKNVKSQFFSIGFTIVSVALLRDNRDIYNIEKQKFDRFEANKRINIFKCLNVYSELLRAIVSSLCSFQPNKRIDVSQLWAWITKYERKIMTKKPFSIEEIPPKINECIIALRTSILSIEPSISVLNLNSIKSLKSSQAQGVNRGSGEKNHDIKTLKSVENNSRIDRTLKKKSSKITFNDGKQQKIIYTAADGGYFSNQVIKNSQVSHSRFQSEQKGRGNPSFYNQGNKIQTSYTFVNQMNSLNLRFEPRRVQKSPEGYYSPRGSNNFKIFIQYKSPTKPDSKQNAQTVSALNGQVVRNAKGEENKQSSHLQQKGSENALYLTKQNKLIEQEINSQKVKSYGEQKVEQNFETRKKLSPIHKILESDKVPNDGVSPLNGEVNGVSEVISEEVIISPIDPVPSEDYKIRTFSQNQHQQTSKQVDFYPHELNSNPKDCKQKVYESNDSITGPFLENFRGLSPVKKQSMKRIARHDSKRMEEELSRQKDMKRIQNALSMNDLQRHAIEEELYELTRDNGCHVVPPIQEIFQSSTVKLEAQQTHQNEPEISPNSDQLAPSQDQKVAQILSAQQNEVQKVSNIQDSNQMINSNEQNVQKRNKSGEINQNSQLNFIEQKIDEIEPQMSKQIQKEIFQMGLQINELKDNFSTEKNAFFLNQKAQNLSMNKPEHIQNLQEKNLELIKEAKVVQNDSTEKILDKKIASQKQPSDKIVSPDSHHQVKIIEQNLIQATNLNNQTNIVIDEEQIKTNIGVLQSKTENLTKSKINNELETQTDKEIQNQNQKLISLNEQKLTTLDPENHRKIDQNKLETQTYQEKYEQIERNQQIEHSEQVPKSKIQKNEEVRQNEVKLEKVKKLQSPFEQLDLRASEQRVIQQFVTIQQVLPTQQQIVSTLHSSDGFQHKVQGKQGLSNPHVYTHLQNQISNFEIEPREEPKEILQEICDVSLNGSRTVTTYQTVNYHHQIDLGGNQQPNHTVFNLVQVNQTSFSPEKQLVRNQDHKDSAKNHQNIIEYHLLIEKVNNGQQVNLQHMKQNLENQIQVNEQKQVDQKIQNTQNIVENKSQKVVQKSIEVKSIRLKPEYDAFLKEIQQTNAKLQQLEEAEHTVQKQQPHSVNTTQPHKLISDHHEKDLYSIASNVSSNYDTLLKGLHEEVKNKKEFGLISKDLLDDQFLRKVQEISRQINGIPHNQTDRVHQNQIYEVDHNQTDVHSTQKMGKQNLEIKQSEHAGQNLAQLEARQISVDKQDTFNSYGKGEQENSHYNEIKSSLIDFDIVQKPIENREKIEKHEVLSGKPKVLQVLIESYEVLSTDNHSQEITLPQPIQIQHIERQEHTEQAEHIEEIQKQTDFIDIQQSVDVSNDNQTIIAVFQQQIVQKPIEMSLQISQTSQRNWNRNKPKDFLDEVMNVNKVINHEQDRNYELNNKYLNSSNKHTQ